VTVVPLLGSYLLGSARAEDGQGLYMGPGYRIYRRTVRGCLRFRWVVIVALMGLTLVCACGFDFVKQGFFPTSNAPMFLLNLHLPQGADIRESEAEVLRLESIISGDPEVTAVSSFIGAGSTRFHILLAPEQPDFSCAQLAIRVRDAATISDVIERVTAQLREANPDLRTVVHRFQFTAGSPYKIEARFSGLDISTLRSLSEAALDVYLKHELINIGTDWRQQRLALVPRFDEAGARRVPV